MLWLKIRKLIGGFLQKLEVAKAERSSQPEYTAKEGSEHGYEFFTQSAGKNNVRNQGYATNNHLIDYEEVKNKGAIMENSDVTTRESPYYPTAFSTFADILGTSRSADADSGA